MVCEIGRSNRIHIHEMFSIFSFTDRWWNVDFRTTSCLSVAPQFTFSTRYILCCSNKTHTHIAFDLAFWHVFFAFCLHSNSNILTVPFRKKERRKWIECIQHNSTVVFYYKINRIYFVLCFFSSINNICIRRHTKHMNWMVYDSESSGKREREKNLKKIDTHTLNVCERVREKLKVKIESMNEN